MHASKSHVFIYSSYLEQPFLTSFGGVHGLVVADFCKRLSRSVARRAGKIKILRDDHVVCICIKTTASRFTTILLYFEGMHTHVRTNLLPRRHQQLQTTECQGRRVQQRSMSNTVYLTLPSFSVHNSENSRFSLQGVPMLQIRSLFSLPEAILRRQR